MMERSPLARVGAGCIAATVVSVVAGAQGSTPSTQTASAGCRVAGRVTSGGVPIPGATLVVRAGEAVQLATSTDLDGSYSIQFAPRVWYRLTIDATGFAGTARDLTLTEPPCDQTLDVQIALAPRHTTVETTAARATPLPGTDRTSAATTPAGRPGGGRANAGRGQPGQAAQRFQTLNVQADASGLAVADAAQGQDNEDLARLLPAGFSAQNAQAEAIAITGSGDATNLDRGLMNGRLQAINAGQLDPLGPGGFNGSGGSGGSGGLGGSGGSSGAGGFNGSAAAAAVRSGGRGGFVLGGRGGRGQPRTGIRHLHVRRIGAGQSAVSAAAGRAGEPTAIRAEQLRRHVRRTAQDSRRLRRHESSDEFPDQLHRNPVEQRLRSVRHGSDRRHARAAIFRRARSS